MSKTQYQNISEYNKAQIGETKLICDKLLEIIKDTLPKAESKIWYGAPVWFKDGNPLAGYNVRKRGGVVLLFWSGQAFEEPELKVEGKFKAAQIVYENVKDIKITDLKRYLKKSYRIMYDYKNIIKNKGKIHII
jgi:Domain of unknown function (DU1801)